MRFGGVVLGILGRLMRFIGEERVVRVKDESCLDRSKKWMWRVRYQATGRIAMSVSSSESMVKQSTTLNASWRRKDASRSHSPAEDKAGRDRFRLPYSESLDEQRV